MLKEIREARGVTQVAVAKHLGVTRQTYAGYEENPGQMSIEQAFAVCDFLNCSINDIFLPKKVN